MYKDFVNVTPESGGAGTTSIAVAADENEGAARSTSLNIAGGGVTRTVSITQKKMLVENQIEVKYWLDAATSGTGKSIYLEANTNVCHLLKEVDFSPSGDGGSMQNIPFFQYDFEINNFNYTNKTAWYLALEANILGTLIDTVTEYLILEWNLGKGDGWERMEFMWENTFEGYQYWRNTTPNVYPNEYPTVKTVQMRVGIGDNTDPEPIHTYLAQFTVNIVLSPRP